MSQNELSEVTQTRIVNLLRERNEPVLMREIAKSLELTAKATVLNLGELESLHRIRRILGTDDRLRYEICGP
ncbi:MAG: hypothetical protein JSS68_15175 [Actinobacteria bacterium]|nr:hypothetical protein [Actinomycetota bacterium]